MNPQTLSITMEEDNGHLVVTLFRFDRTHNRYIKLAAASAALASNRESAILNILARMRSEMASWADGLLRLQNLNGA